MQRQIIHGVPYFVDNQNRLFTWDTEADPQHIGSYDPTTGNAIFAEDHLGKLAGRLCDWRSKQSIRARKAIASSRRNTSQQAAAAEDSDDDE